MSPAPASQPRSSPDWRRPTPEHPQDEPGQAPIRVAESTSDEEGNKPPKTFPTIAPAGQFGRFSGQGDAGERCPPWPGAGDGGSPAPGRFTLPKAAEMHTMLRHGAEMSLEVQLRDVLHPFFWTSQLTSI